MLYEIPLKNWQQIKTETLQNSKKSYHAKKNSPEAALGFFRYHEDFGTYQATNALALTLEKDFPDNLEIMNELGYWHYKNQNYSKSVELYEKSNLLEPDNHATLSMLGELHLKLGLYDKSKKYYFLLKEFDHANDYFNFIKLTTLLRENGKPNEAYEVLKFVLKNYYEQAIKDYSFVEEVKLAEKASPTYKSILPEGAVKNRTGKFAVALLVAVIFSSYFFNAHLKDNQNLYIINHVIKDTELTLNNKQVIKLEPGELRKIKLSEGNYHALIKVSQLKPYAINFSTRNTLFNRYFKKNTFVLNIKGAGIIIREAIIYGDSPSPPNSESSYQIYTGENFYTFHEIAYPFTEPPKSILLDDGVKGKIKFSLSLLNSEPYDSARELFKYKEHLKPETVLSFMESHMKCGYKPENFIRLYKTKSRKLKLSRKADKFLKNMEN
jgi:tetratricopeptide (TPR) repeat protein